MVKLPDGTALRVVRNGKGRSRLNRWRSSPLPDGSVGEINIRDLTDVLSKSAASSIQVTVQTPDGFYDVVLDTDCVMGRAGREAADVAYSLKRMPEYQRRIAAIDQIRTLPVSGENLDHALSRLESALEAGELSVEDLSVLSEESFTLCASDDLFALAKSLGYLVENPIGRQSDVPKEEVDQLIDLWKQYGVTPSAARRVIPSNVPEIDPENVVFSLYGMSLGAVSMFVSAGFRSKDDMSSILASGAEIHDLSSYVSHGFKTRDDICYLASNGVSGLSAALFVTHTGITNVRDIKELYEAGLNPNLLKYYSKAGLANKQDLMYLLKSGIDESMTCLAIECGVTAKEDILDLHKVGVSVGLVEVCGRIASSPKEELIEAANLGVDYAFAKLCVGSGVGSLRDIITLKRDGVQSSLLKALCNTGASSVQDIKDLHSASFDPYFVEECGVLGPISYSSVKHLADSGVSPGMLRACALSGIRDATDIAEMSSMGITPKFVKACFYFDIKTSAELKNTFSRGVKSFDVGR